METSQGRIPANEEVTVSVSLTNIGDRDGIETVQLSGQHLVSSFVTPVRELKRFERVPLTTGESASVEFELRSADLAGVRPDESRVVESRTYEFSVSDLAESVEIE